MNDNESDNLSQCIDRMQLIKDSIQGRKFEHDQNEEICNFFTQMEAVEQRTSITNQISQIISPKCQIPNVEYEAENGKTATPKRRSLTAKFKIK